MTRVAALNKNRSLIKNASIIVSRMIPYTFCRNRKLRMKMDTLAKSLDFDTCTFGGNIFGNWGYKEIMPLTVIGAPTEYDFNGITIYGVENYDRYLTNLYGEWRKLPPKEKQITHHDSLELRLDRSYLK